MTRNVLPSGSEERKRLPLCTGLLDYFSAALAEVAKVSFVGNEKHNPGEPLHWSRGKSGDHADCVARHLLERGKFDEVVLPDGRVYLVRHSAEMAWRALAVLQEELEEAGEAPPSRASRFAEPPEKKPQLRVGEDIIVCDYGSVPHAYDLGCRNARLSPPDPRLAGAQPAGRPFVPKKFA